MSVWRPFPQAGDGVQPMEYEVKLLPRTQILVDLVVDVDKAIKLRDFQAIDKLRGRLAKERHGHLLIRKIDEAM
jgi:hypothetical protein